MAEARVLVVYGDSDVAEGLCDALGDGGYHASVLPRGGDTAATLEHDGIDVVVLDLALPGSVGWDILATLQAHEQHAAVPVVAVVTSGSDEVEVIRAKLSGAATCLTGPVEAGSLLEAVGEVVAAAAGDLRQRRRAEVAELLQRLAELEAGRARSPTKVRLSRLERLLPKGPTTSVDPARLARLTAREREVAALFAAGVGARHVAAHLGSSRANVYATRKRIGRKLGVTTELVADTAHALGLAAEAQATDTIPG